MSAGRTRTAVAGLSLSLVLAGTMATLALGAVVKQPCASGEWRDGRQYRHLCYSDIVPLYATEHLTGGRLPYLDPCPATAGDQCDEYPVLTMYFMRGAAWLSHSFAQFFWTNAILLSLAALVTSIALYRAVGERALYFSFAPTLLIYAFVNWDLLAVALATVATLAYLRNRDETAGILLGLGAAAKAYPALLLIPFALDRLRHGRKGGATTIAVWAVVSYVLVNAPFMLVAGHRWSTFFRFNSNRAVDWDSIWFIVCQRLHGGSGCPWSPRMVDVLSLAVFGALAWAALVARRRTHPEFPRWKLGFPLLVLFLLTNKVYSPQYGLWLLPWFPLALPSVRLFVAFEATDIAVFVTRFSWFGRLAGLGGAPIGAFQLALVARAIVLVVCVLAWTARGAVRPVEEPAAPTPSPAPV